MLKQLIKAYLPYSIIDALLVTVLIAEFRMGRLDLFWASVPLLIWGMVCFTRKTRRMDDAADH